MKKTTNLILALLFSMYLAFGQEKKTHTCGSDELHLKTMKDDVSYKEQFEANTKAWIDYNIRKKNSVNDNKNLQNYLSNPKNLTVVFHDMVTGVQSAYANNINNYDSGIVQVLNNYFNGNLGGNDTGIQFCMARQDINMNCIISFEKNTNLSIVDKDNTGHITTIVSDAQSIVTPEFPQNKFVNIYIVDEILGSVSGFATLPSSHGTYKDGIFIERQWLSSAQGLKVLVHEIGHYLGLFHTFGICDPDILSNLNGPTLFPECSCLNSDCLFNGDMVCDTPPMQLYDGIDCNSTFPLQSCSGVMLNQIDKKNFMDYIPNSCRQLFTQGQIDRMQFMLDDNFGARSSLLSVGYCIASCCEIDSCELTINPPTIIQNNQVEVNTLLAFTSLYDNCSSVTPPTMSYAWTLTLIGNNNQTVVATGTGSNYSVTPLIPGNYFITVTAFLASNGNCSETIDYYFQVLPTPDYSGPSENICGIIPPMDDWNKWYRELPQPNTVQTELNSPNLTDVLVVNESTYYNDPNFGAITLPNGILELLRVGAVIEGTNNLSYGRSSYANVTFNPTPENCKFRIYFIGMTSAEDFNDVSTANNFLNNSTNGNETTLGFVSLYKLNSNVNNTNPTPNITYGLDHLGNLWNYNYCDNSMIFGREPASLFTSNYNSSMVNETIDNLHFKKMNEWRFIDLDYSEFANLNLEVTLTFFSKSDNIINGLNRSYGYFAVDCLGGGIPSSIEWNPENIDISCTYPTENGACANIEIPLPKYVHSQYDSPFNNISYINNSGNLFASITVEKSIDNTNFSIMPANSFSVAYNGGITAPRKAVLNICNNQPNVQTVYYKIKYKMLNQEIIRTIKVTNQFYHNTFVAPCASPQIPNTNIYGGTIPVGKEHDYLICLGQDQIPNLTFTPPCFSPNPTYNYRWKVNGVVMSGINSESLSLSQSYLEILFSESYYNPCSISIKREVSSEDIYCQTPIWFESESYTIYNIQSNANNSEFTAENLVGSPPCLSDDIKFVFDLNLEGVCIPSSVLDNYLLVNNIVGDNTVDINFFSENNMLFHSENINFGQNIDFDQNNLMTFIISNFDSNTSQFLFHPNNNDVTIEITCNFYGCVKTYQLHKSLYIGPSAVGGQIGLATNCDLNNIYDIDSVPSFSVNGFTWEFSYIPGTWQEIPGSPSTASLLGVPNYFSVFPVKIRRRAFGSEFCPDDDYSNEITYQQPLSVIGFNLPSSYCSLDIIPDLPNYVLDSGIQGTWSPSNIITGPGPYIFTPSSTACGESYTYNVVIDNAITPVFQDLPTSTCEGYPTPQLPLVDDFYNITGTWSQPQVNNSVLTYTFTPDTGLCANTVQHNVTVYPSINATFTEFQTIYCQGSGIIYLPTLCDQGFEGEWDQGYFDTNVIGTQQFIYNSIQPCVNSDITITVLPGNQIPQFNLPTSLCEGAIAPILLENSLNEISGHWDEDTVDTSIPGIHNYTFTPDPNQCALPYSYDINILENCGVFLTWNGVVGCQISEESNDDNITQENVNIFDGFCIKICENSVVTYTITGSVSLISSTDWNITGGTILNQSNTFCEIKWNSNELAYALQGIIHLSDGSTLNIDKCIEKVESPFAQIGILPDLKLLEHTLCVKNPINFQNLSNSDSGNENLYYQWNFGDGTYSTEFEPTHIYSQEGTYHVVLTVSNGCSCVSTAEILIHIIDKTIEISCPAVACEGQISTYSIDSRIINECHSLLWYVIGGHVVGQSQGVSSVEVIWDHVDDEGFGYVFVQSSECFQCVSSVKIPVIKNSGTIKGKEVICPISQHIYTLPQWPTTEFNWSLNDNGTGATLVVSNQRNEIFINSYDSGTLELSCQYYNTLLGCGGNASLTINVKSYMYVNGPTKACQDEELNFIVAGDSGNQPINLSYTINGPNGFIYSGNSTPFDIEFPEPGVYAFNVKADNFCMESPFEVTVNPLPNEPTAIVGNSEICPGITTQFSCAATIGNTTHWSVEGGSILGSIIGNQVTVSFDPTATSYSVSAWYENESCASDPITLPLTTPILNTTISSLETVVCGSTYGDYTVDEFDSEIYDWSIEPADAGSIQNGQNTNTIHILWNQQDQTAIVKLTMRKCGKDFIADDLAVIIIPPPTVTIYQINNIVCAGEAIYFDIDLPAPGVFSSSVWDFGDNTGLHTFNYGQQISHEYQDQISVITTYDVTASVIGAAGCLIPSTANMQVNINPTPVAHVSPNVNFNSCANTNGLPMTYTVNLAAGSNVQWFFNGYNYATTATIDASMEGTYYAVVTNSYGCQSVSRVYNTTCDSTAPSNCIQAPPMEFNVVNTSCQGIAVQVVNGGGTDVSGFSWGALAGTSATITSNTNGYSATNILPGIYQLPITPIFIAGTNYCPTTYYKSIIIPCKADLNFTIDCDSNSGNYNVTLLDASKYYTPIPTINFEYQFSTDDGLTWTTVSSNSDFSTLLPPGTYQIGIQVHPDGYPSCTTFRTLVLPNLPTADFDIPTSVCLNTPMQFIAPNNTDPDLTYQWDFNGEAINLQPNPVKTFTSAGSYSVTLTVKNTFGCEITSDLKLVEVLGEEFQGILNISPINNCIGENLTISYDVGLGNSLPESYFWYQNEVTTTPFAITSNFNNQLVVTEPGQYFAYVADANGCLTYTTNAVAANFIPTPDQPIVIGTETICKGSFARLEVPVNPSISYKWWLNGVPQNQWNNFTEVGIQHNQTGVFLYEVIAQVQSDAGSYCTSNVASFNVHVIEKPDLPIIDFDFQSCTPYLVEVFVSNPQAGIEYEWSNGETGVNTQMIHDGPIRVIAKSNDCLVSAQIDLPLDIYMHTWYYPTGCYTFCDSERKEQNYIIGPLVGFEHWKWLQDFGTIESGTGQVAPLSDLSTSSYQLLLSTAYCETTLSNINIKEQECELCEFDFEITEIIPTLINGECLYQLNILIGNPFGNPLQVNLASLGVNGYFVQSSFVVPAGGDSYTVLFYPLNGFTGGASTIIVNALIDDKGCYSEFEFELPVLCEGTGKQNGKQFLNEANRELLLLAAPNPTNDVTTIYYNYGNEKGNYQIEILDMYGRTLQQKIIKENNGTLLIDCSKYEAGQYFIVMKIENQILKNCKLIIK